MKASIILLSVLLFVSLQSLGQCHKSKDEFTGNSSMWTDKISITKGGGLTMLKKFDDDCRYKIYLQFMAKDGKFYLTMAEDADYCFCTITGVMFKLGNGKTIIKQNLKASKEVKTALGSEQYSFIEITKEELAILATEAVVKVRVISNGCVDHPSIDEELEDKTANKIREGATCMTKN